MKGEMFFSSLAFVILFYILLVTDLSNLNHHSFPRKEVKMLKAYFPLTLGNVFTHLSSWCP